MSFVLALLFEIANYGGRTFFSDTTLTPGFLRLNLRIAF